MYDFLDFISKENACIEFGTFEFANCSPTFAYWASRVVFLNLKINIKWNSRFLEERPYQGMGNIWKKLSQYIVVPTTKMHFYPHHYQN